MESICLPPGAPSYPAVLHELITAKAPEPPTLYLRGALPAATGIAIVGTRAASTEALAFTRALATALAQEGFSIWSGGARGVDAAAHEGALDAGAPTVLVAGGGLSRPYPPEHAALFERVLATGGALLARVPDDARPLPHRFLQRNALLAAMTVATVVVEAAIESGARSTAAIARRLGRLVLAVPHAPWYPRGTGCLAELDLGASPVTSARDVLSALGRTSGAHFGAEARPLSRVRTRSIPRVRRSSTGIPTSASLAGTTPSLPGFEGSGRSERGLEARPSAPEMLPLDAEEQAVFDALDARPTHLDEVCERTGLAPPRVAAALLTLTLHAVVVEGPAGSYWRTGR
ncbi:DNA-processing protein DprA [Chondromyces crocatus]|uniref:DNA processing protein DprA n=1 Tax=Chondromyces crocatus TaxID=52 RepID=A0A0K1EDK2_CHOCO|nr:DNA-processing protein DprA [Chondromyces crocatus]AKT38955.1 DNA processing protein DprA [Chondromyces crocatus]